MKKSRRNFIKYLAVIIFTLFIIESFTYGYFIYSAYRAKCFFLIGNQRVLDTLIKARLIYSTYYCQGRRNNIYIVDDDLGYSLGKNKDTGNILTNSQGLRSDWEYQLKPQNDFLRVAAFGDSFVFCDNEKNTDTWEYYLENSTGNLEVLNFGVSGYGFGQSYLRYLKDGLKFSPDIVFFNYIYPSSRDKTSLDAILGGRDLRCADLYRANFEIKDNILISKSMLPFDLFDKSFRNSHIYGPAGINEDEGFWSWKGFSILNTGLLIKSIYFPKDLSKPVESTKKDEEIFLKMLENLLWTVKKNNSTILFFGHIPFNYFSGKVKELLKQYEENIEYAGPQVFNSVLFKHRVSRQSLLNHTNHYNARGNQLYAEAVLEVLKSRKWGKGDRIFEFSEEKNSFQRLK